ncbi:hypothetical protein OI25_8048 (plasmid) [Paraburkholderia fungorum]|jgi:hypothetical protein|uniref:Uncharacterized protein n=1 Tax=Paraburkholderia fungorum TaxID=134537 RepID=A0AAU8SQI5_9BURK|nr:hypothetical protein OI25_8048 [Paraburkholderia fungorum]MDE1008435.1 hypothetical protein [Paraburkholderia fungorum]PRZ52358.1 hypothetical protein BX589_11432 [Paraburkholderia fungorum]
MQRKLILVTLLSGLPVAAAPEVATAQVSDGFSAAAGAAGSLTSAVQGAGQLVSSAGSTPSGTTGLTRSTLGGSTAMGTGMTNASSASPWTPEQQATAMQNGAVRAANALSSMGLPAGSVVTPCPAWIQAMQAYAASYSSGGAVNPKAARQAFPSMAQLCAAPTDGARGDGPAGGSDGSGGSDGGGSDGGGGGSE